MLTGAAAIRACTRSAGRARRAAGALAVALVRLLEAALAHVAGLLSGRTRRLVRSGLRPVRFAFVVGHVLLLAKRIVSGQARARDAPPVPRVPGGRGRRGAGPRPLLFVAAHFPLSEGAIHAPSRPRR